MKRSFIFYGSLLEEEWRYKVTELIPSCVLQGHIFGEIFLVSELRPEGVCRYPMLGVENEKIKIAAEYIVYQSSPADIQKLMGRLKEYEGPLYQLIGTRFYSQDELIRAGLVFAESKLHVPGEAIRIEPINCTSSVFDWRQYNAQFS